MQDGVVPINISPIEGLPEHFCVLPWAHLYVTPTGKVFPCSKHENNSIGNIKDTKLTTLWQGPELENFRKTMLDQAPSPLCFFCNEMRKSGAEPYSAKENRKFPEALSSREWTKGPSLVGKAKLTSLELRFSNVCNLRCRTCFPQLSSGWYAEGFEIYGTSLKRPLKAFQSIQSFLNFLKDCVNDLEEINVLGGEPLIHDEFYILLEKLIELGKTQVKIDITTNFTRLHHKSWNFLELASQFQNLSVSASFDGVGKQAEFIRKGSQWTDIEENFKLLKPTNIPFAIYPCISVLNSFHITEAIERWIDLEMFSAERSLARILNFVTNRPIYYNIRILDEIERRRLKEHYRDFLKKLSTKSNNNVYFMTKRYLNEILKFLDGGNMSEQRDEFRRITSLLDKNRNESFASLFPELSSLGQS